MFRGKHHSRIPMPVPSLVGVGSVGDSNSSHDHELRKESDKTMLPDSSRSTSSTKSNGKPKSKQTTLNPLAKAMEKRSKQDKSVKVKASSETYYDEKIESQSQLRYRNSKTDHERRKEDLMRQLKEAEGEVEVMKSLLEQRDKLLKESQEEAEHQIKSMEETLEDRENVLITNGIDPVTGQPTVPNQDEKARKQKLEKFTKKKVQDMRERLSKMNNQTERYLADVENTMQYLDSLEVASDRMGLSEETKRYFGDYENEEDLIAKVYNENDAGRKELNSKHPVSKTDDRTAGQQEGDSDSAEDENGPDPTKPQFFITRRDAQGQPPLETRHSEPRQSSFENHDVESDNTDGQSPTDCNG